MTRYLPACRPPKLYLPVASVVVVAPSVSPALCVSLPSSSYHLDLHSFPTRRSSDLLPSPLTSSRTWPALVPSLKLPKSLLVSLKPELTVKDRKSTRLNASHQIISYYVLS